MRKGAETHLVSAPFLCRDVTMWRLYNICDTPYLGYFLRTFSARNCATWSVVKPETLMPMS